MKTYKNALPVDEIIRRARSRLGESAYNVFHNNCEHFCLWCIVGDHTSPQVDRITLISAPSVAACVGIASTGVVATAGSVAGLSGSGIMSGLATSGAVVGGGAMAGVALLGAAPGVLVATVMNHTVLADNPMLAANERASRKVGRAASYVGVGAGTVGSIAAVSAAGTTAGLGAAGITSGLAAIGGAVGGGMAAGVVVATAFPVAAGTALGFGIYKVVRWIRT